MAAEGEDRLLTLYADVHYYFSEPGPRPANHRFDKESYVYLYGDVRARRGRIEIANHAGTDNQDAFTGYLDNVTIQQSARHPALCTLTVNGAGSKPLPDQHWRLPSTDPRDEGSYQFKLHTLDLYFWTDADALHFVQAVSMLLRQEQVQSDALPISPTVSSPPAHEQPMSPVVQNLENLAVSHTSAHGSRSPQNRDSVQSDAAFSAGRGARAGSTTSTTQAAPPSASPLSNASRQQSRGSQGFTPLAYNPAAPAAPEKIAHREPTPPPPEGDTGLAGAAMRDAGVTQTGRTSAAPSFGPAATPSFGPAAEPSFGPGVAPSFGPGAPSTIGGMQSATSTPSQAFSPLSAPHTPANFSSASTQHPMSPSSRTSITAPPNFPGPPSRTESTQSGFPQATPTNEILGPDFAHPPVPLQHLQPQYPDYLAQRISQNNTPSTQGQGYHAPGSHHNKPHGVPENVRIGGYSDYNYGGSGAQQPTGGYHDANPYDTGNYAIHQQAYRPTQDEAAAHKKNSKHKADGDARPGKLEAGAERVEKKVNRFLRGLEKKIG